MQHFETVEVVEPIMDFLVNRCGAILYENYLEAKMPSHNATMVTVWQSGVIN